MSFIPEFFRPKKTKVQLPASTKAKIIAAQTAAGLRNPLEQSKQATRVSNTNTITLRVSQALFAMGQFAMTMADTICFEATVCDGIVCAAADMKLDVDPCYSPNAFPYFTVNTATDIYNYLRQNLSLPIYQDGNDDCAYRDTSSQSYDRCRLTWHAYDVVNPQYLIDALYSVCNNVTDLNPSSSDNILGMSKLAFGCALAGGVLALGCCGAVCCASRNPSGTDEEHQHLNATHPGLNHGSTDGAAVVTSSNV